MCGLVSEKLHAWRTGPEKLSKPFHRLRFEKMVWLHSTMHSFFKDNVNAKKPLTNIKKLVNITLKHHFGNELVLPPITQ